MGMSHLTVTGSHSISAGCDTCHMLSTAAKGETTFVAFKFPFTLFFAYTLR